MAVDGGAFGIVGAHLGGEPERYLLEMRGVPMRSKLKPGTLIVSSGLGGTFPRGIPVGTVIAEMKTSELWARTYLLRPAVAPADVSDVMVLLPARTTAGVQTVWKTGLHADSAVKSIVAAGDSLARLAARRDSANVPRDSTQRRDSTLLRRRQSSRLRSVRHGQRRLRRLRARRRRPLHETDGFLSHADRVRHSGDAALHAAPACSAGARGLTFS